MSTNKKRLTISFNDKDLLIIEKLKLKIKTKQISKVISYAINCTFLNEDKEKDK